jgi:hypothetical protein
MALLSTSVAEHFCYVLITSTMPSDQLKLLRLQRKQRFYDL